MPRFVAKWPPQCPMLKESLPWPAQSHETLGSPRGLECLRRNGSSHDSSSSFCGSCCFFLPSSGGSRKQHSLRAGSHRGRCSPATPAHDHLGTEVRERVSRTLSGTLDLLLRRRSPHSSQEQGRPLDHSNHQHAPKQQQPRRGSRRSSWPQRYGARLAAQSIAQELAKQSLAPAFAYPRLLHMTAGATRFGRGYLGSFRMHSTYSFAAVPNTAAKSKVVL